MRGSTGPARVLRTHCALLLRRVCLEGVGFYPLAKGPLRRENPWVQDLCEHPSVLLYPASQGKNNIRWPLGSNHHPCLQSPCWIVNFSYPIAPLS